MAANHKRPRRAWRWRRGEMRADRPLLKEPIVVEFPGEGMAAAWTPTEDQIAQMRRRHRRRFAWWMVGVVVSMLLLAPLLAAIAGYQAYRSWGRAAHYQRAARLLEAPMPTRQVDPEAARRAGLDPAEAERRLSEAEAVAMDIDAAVTDAKLQGLRRMLAAIVAEARAALDHLEKDPGDFAKARVFFRAILPGARDAIQTLRGIAEPDKVAAAEMRVLLGDVLRAATQLRAALEADENAALRVEMDVLSERLAAAR